MPPLAVTVNDVVAPAHSICPLNDTVAVRAPGIATLPIVTGALLTVQPLASLTVTVTVAPTEIPANTPVP